MPKTLKQKMRTAALATLLAAFAFIRTGLAESGDPIPETNGRAIAEEAMDARQSFARRPSTMLERAPSDPQLNDNGCPPLGEPEARNAKPRRGSGPLGPQFMMGVE